MLKNNHLTKNKNALCKHKKNATKKQILMKFVYINIK